jgi:CheY-like chemotaxis protein
MKPTKAPRRILLVDDSPRVRAVLRAILSDLAADLEECYDGDQVLASYEAFRPDLVLMDVRMPGMDGIQATALLKKTHPTARIVIVSDHEQDDVRAAARQAGAEAYVVKTNLVVLRELLAKR